MPDRAPECQLLSVNGNNQVTNTGVTYDSDGNLTADGLYTYAWDAENRLNSAAGVTYTYDAFGQRVQKSSGTLYWFGLGGSVPSETDAAGNEQHEYVYVQGERIARRHPSGAVYYYHQDPTESAVVITDGLGAIQQESDFYPYGGELSITTMADPNIYKFTGHERDGETGLDHTLYRKYASNWGRWHTPDPYAASGASANPQTWNRYAYVSNDPVLYGNWILLSC